MFFICGHFSLHYLPIHKKEYRICTYRPLAIYKNFRVFWWWFIEIFQNFARKKPQKVDFWSKNVAVYSNFIVVVVSLRVAYYRCSTVRGWQKKIKFFFVNFKPKSLKGLKILDIIITMLDIRQTTTMLHLLGHIMVKVDMLLIISIILDIIKTILDNRQTTMLDHLDQIISIVDMVLIVNGQNGIMVLALEHVEVANK